MTFDRACQLDLPDSIYVKKQRTTSAGFGGSTRRTLARFVDAVLKFRVFSFGPLFVRQETGIPIGGPWSNACLSVVLSNKEHTFIRMKWPVIAEALGVAASMKRTLLAKRYVDDLLLGSYILCESCTLTIQNMIYEDVIVFDVDSKGRQYGVDEVRFKYLDMQLSVSMSGAKVSQYVYNEQFLLHGNGSDIVRLKQHPFLGNLCPRLIRRFSGELTGRRSRWKQLDLHGAQLVNAVLFEILELTRAGFPKSVIKELWSEQKFPSVDCEMALAILNLELPDNSSDAIVRSLHDLCVRLLQLLNRRFLHSLMPVPGSTEHVHLMMGVQSLLALEFMELCNALAET